MTLDHVVDGAGPVVILEPLLGPGVSMLEISTVSMARPFQLSEKIRLAKRMARTLRIISLPR